MKKQGKRQPCCMCWSSIYKPAAAAAISLRERGKKGGGKKGEEGGESGGRQRNPSGARVYTRTLWVSQVPVGAISVQPAQCISTAATPPAPAAAKRPIPATTLTPPL